MKQIGHLLTRPIGRPPNEVRRSYANFTYQAGSWTKSRRVVTKVEWHPGELYPRVGFIVTNMSRPAERVVAFYNKRGTCEQWWPELQNIVWHDDELPIVSDIVRSVVKLLLSRQHSQGGWGPYQKRITLNTCAHTPHSWPFGRLLKPKIVVLTWETHGALSEMQS
jgi:hypothetical protein